MYLKSNPNYEVQNCISKQTLVLFNHKDNILIILHFQQKTF